MVQTHAVVIPSTVEGPVDEAVVRRLICLAGGNPGRVYGKVGKEHLRTRAPGYNNAAKHWPWLLLVDLNQEAECAPILRAAWLPHMAQWMCFRVAVRETEAWLLGDRDRLARFLRVRVARMPEQPELLPDPKQFMVDSARASRSPAVRQDMVPRPGSGRVVGPAYASRLIEFALDEKSGWRPDVAAQRCDSLRRCISRLKELVRSAPTGG